MQERVNGGLAMQMHVNRSLAMQKHVTRYLVMQIIFAREFLKEVRMKADQVKYLVTNARNGMCQGHRAELFAVKAAKACAALAVSLTVCSSLKTEKSRSENPRNVQWLNRVQGDFKELGALLSQLCRVG